MFTAELDINSTCFKCDNRVVLLRNFKGNVSGYACRACHHYESASSYARRSATTVKEAIIKTDNKTPSCPMVHGDGELGKMTKRTNRRSGKEFWGCLKFPKCRGTRELAPKVSKKEASKIDKFFHGSFDKEKEIKVAQNDLIEGKWYIIKKGLDIEYNSIMYSWNIDMEKYDGTVKQCRRVLSNGDGATFYDAYQYGFAKEWCQGPYDNETRALAVRDKRATWRSKADESWWGTSVLDPGNYRFSGYELVKADSRRVQNGLKAAEASNFVDFHFKHIASGITQVVTFDQRTLPKQPGVILKRVRDLWKTTTPDFEKPAPVIKVKVKTTTTVEDTSSVADSMAKWKLSLKGVEVPDTWNPMADDDDFFVLPVREEIDPLDKKYKEDIDRIFQQYHDRQERRQELGTRLKAELAPEKRSKKRLALYGLGIVSLCVGGYAAVVQLLPLIT